MIISSTEAQNNFGQYLKLAQFEDVIVTKNGKNAVVIKPYKKEEGLNSFIAERAEAYSIEQERISYEEFLRLSEESDNRYEYIDGEVYLMASPSYAHQRIIMELSVLFYNWFKGKKCIPLTSPFDVTLFKSEENINVVQPDILVVCDVENVNARGRYTGVPTLVIEILSQYTRSKDMIRKLDLYSKSGVKEYWVVNPLNKEIYVYYYENREIEAYNVYKLGERVKSMVFEGLEIELKQVFE
ncbi:MAG: type II toxin-antitoxin system prevent-host-death family antitoxin [Clostridiales bacterium]|nr:type II toxin-antitoxin system prevent-host-death family antitoxin [Clostridiales bacterium]